MAEQSRARQMVLPRERRTDACCAVARHVRIADGAEFTLQRDNELMPWDLWPAASRPASLLEVRVTERKAGDKLDVAKPDLVDGVSLLVEVLRFDSVHDRNFLTHERNEQIDDGYADDLMVGDKRLRGKKRYMMEEDVSKVKWEGARGKEQLD